MAPSVPVYSSSNKMSVSKSRHCIIGGTLVWHHLFHYTTIFHKMGFCKLNSNVISFHKDGYSILFLSFRRVLNVIYSFLGNSPASEF